MCRLIKIISRNLDPQLKNKTQEQTQRNAKAIFIWIRSQLLLWALKYSQYLTKEKEKLRRHNPTPHCHIAIAAEVLPLHIETVLKHLVRIAPAKTSNSVLGNKVEEENGRTLMDGTKFHLEPLDKSRFFFPSSSIDVARYFATKIRVFSCAIKVVVVSTVSYTHAIQFNWK
jgi:hypothetical protein